MDEWYEGFPGAITVTDAEGTIIYMNERSKETFDKYGGASLIGKPVTDCHPPRASEMIETMLKEDTGNVYTITKGGKRKLIYQTPWHMDGKVAGLVELSIEIPEQLPHFNRD